MCNATEGCQKPAELKARPRDCSPEQIEKCHGDSSEHPCEGPPEDSQTD